MAPNLWARNVALMALTCCITASGANGVIAFAHGLQKIRECAQRRSHAFTQAKTEAQPKGDDQHRERPLDFGAVMAGPPQDDHARGDGRQPCDKRHHEDALLVDELGLTELHYRAATVRERSL
jgi:hypothetical protein